MKWLGSTVAMHRIANPRTPVRFRPKPTFYRIVIKDMLRYLAGKKIKYLLAN